MTVVAPTPTADAAARLAHDTRWKRILDCVALRQPDRMPVALYATFWLAKYGGITCKQLMYDQQKCAELAERAVLEFDPDAYSPMMVATASGASLDAIGYKQLQWPGHGVGDSQPYQYLDREYMKAEEYDDFIFDPTGYYLHTYLPRIATAFEGFEELPVFPGLHYFRLVAGIRPFAKPRVRQALEHVIRAAEEVDRYVHYYFAFAERMAAMGYPVTNHLTSVSPYDFIADYFRGARGIMTDLFRHKDKLLEALDKAQVFLLRHTIAQARSSGNPVVLIPVHWAPDAFMSDSQFRTFWWPPFRKMLHGMVEAGLIPMPLWEADCTKRLEIIRDVPPASCIYWFERTDMVKVREVLGDVVALRGNLGASLMTTGKPEDVDAAVKRLAQEVFHKGGKLILDCAFGLPDETPIENVRAMFAAARKYAG
jgi:uroporphyrinogen-III decarboxylase